MKSTESWRGLDPSQSAALTVARLELHAALQLVSAVGVALAPAQADYSHTSLSWADNRWVGVRIETPTPFQAALEPVSLTLLVLDGVGRPLAQLPLLDQNLPQALTWLSAQISQLGAEGERLTLGDVPPALEGRTGAPFTVGSAALRQALVNYFTNTQSILASLVEARSDAAPLYLWPHNFDLATLITLGDGSKTIGVGLSAGDASYPQPYWYITAYPYPVPPLPSLPKGGVWHTDPWVGAVLTGAEVLPEPALQPQQIQGFIDTAVEIAQELLSV